MKLESLERGQRVRAWVRLEPRITCPRPNVAFTLVELLVVVAVVAVLASLILPALARSKDTARRIQCVSNIRQLGFAAMMYWDDNAGQTFAYRGVFTNNGDVFWFGWLERGAEGDRAFDESQGALYRYLDVRGLAICPALEYISPRFKLKATGAAYGYGINRNLTAPTLTHIVRMIKPADTVLFADAAQVNTFQPPASAANPLLEEFYYVHELERTAHFRHRQTATVIFGDGHVDRERAVPDSYDLNMPEQRVGRLRPECLALP
ncbi:MAG TPA: prepilin-type N-terminal cleavage/methylation domain-containing protein [Verrucomicrobiae bacterium]|nr:prepilin-type N-terminal cleavage/methylation domain-containing protein [Verrucomicrobiae bacterium]